MKNLWMALSGLLFCFSYAAFADPPPFNLVDIKKALIVYHDSGAYDRDIAAIVAGAKNYLDQRVKNVPLQSRKKLAVIYDIDETALSNYASMAASDFGESKAYIDASMAKGNAAATKPVLELYQYGKRLGVTEIFITGRHERFRQATVSNLMHVGYKDWDGLYLEPENAHFKSAADFKAPLRQKLEAKGYDISLNLGDQCSDMMVAPDVLSPTKTISLPKTCGSLRGDYEDAAVKLPNPYYIVP